MNSKFNVRITYSINMITLWFIRNRIVMLSHNWSSGKKKNVQKMTAVPIIFQFSICILGIPSPNLKPFNRMAGCVEILYRNSYKLSTVIVHTSTCRHEPPPSLQWNFLFFCRKWLSTCNSLIPIENPRQLKGSTREQPRRLAICL